MTEMKVSELKVTIAGYSKKGHGIANEPKRVEVVGSVKGDVILAKLLKRVKKRHQTEVLEMIEPSKERCEAKCKHAGVCGGCKWQQIAYKQQLKEKKESVEHLFEDNEVSNVIGCKNPWHYRSKMEFSFSQNKDGDHFLGLMRSRGRFKVENIDECFIAPVWMTEVLGRVRNWWKETTLGAFHPHSGRGLLRTLTMRSGENSGAKMVFITLNGSNETALTKTNIKQFVKAAKFDEKTSVFLIVQHAVKGKETTFSEMHLAGPPSMDEILLGQKFNISPRAFFQPNPKMAETMFTDVIEIVKERGSKKVLDLYCGIGTIGILLASHVQQVIGVELCAHAICDAKEVIEESGLENIQVFCQDVKKFLADLDGLYKPDTVIIDPPRCGLTKEGIADLKKIRADTIIYVSCNPATQAEDIRELDEYQIVSIKPYDQFPHTIHVENIVVLTLK